MYGKSTVMTYFHRRHLGRDDLTISESEGSSKGSPTGEVAAILGLQACLHVVAKAFKFAPGEQFRMWAEADDITIGGGSAGSLTF